MHHTDLIYRREVHGITRRQFANLIGRAYGTVAKWENGERDPPPWLQDWLEYMDMELIRGKIPEKAPQRVADIHSILYPGRAQNLSARRLARKTMLQDREAKRESQRLRLGKPTLTVRQIRQANRDRMERNRRK